MRVPQLGKGQNALTLVQVKTCLGLTVSYDTAGKPPRTDLLVINSNCGASVCKILIFKWGLVQTEQSCRFPPPKIFTNALLHSHDITTVIRDTEAHERALFTLAPSDQISTSRRSTFHGLKSNGEPVNSSGLVRVPKHGTTVATLLGAELGEQIRKGRTSDGKEKGEVDVEILLQGAERLCHV